MTLAHAVDEDYAVALRGIKAALASPREAMLAKTKMMNDLLNEHIPYFRCSDELAVKTYYYLWALYFMYFTEIGEGWDHYPHTQTAVNNFMGLHLWDSWAYIQAGSWVADKWRWGHGNALQWQYMVRFKNKANCMPDTFGKAWYSPTCRMVFVGATEPSWQQFRRSGDMRYLAEVYDKLYRPLYGDNRGPTKSFGADVSAVDSLVGMARTLGREADIDLWRKMRPAMVKAFRGPWSGRWKGFYGGRGVPWKDVWALAALQSAAMPKEWAREMVDEFVLDTDKGFCSPVGVNTRAADSPPNGIFRCSTISSWLAIDGMFRQDCDYAGMLMTVNHLKGMVREWGYPVAPEAWNDEFKAWGSRYYNWDIAIVLPMIEWLAGVDYSIPDGTFTVAPHLPPTWDFIETYTPVVVEGRTRWVRARVERERTRSGCRQRTTVSGNPLRTLVIAPYHEDREVLRVEGSGEKVTADGETRFRSGGASARAVATLGAKTRTYKTLAWVTPRSRIFHDKVAVNAENLIPGTVLRYTLDGAEPGAGSPRFGGPITLDRTTTLRLRAFGADGATYSEYKATYAATDLNPAVEPGGLRPGLRYSLYELGERPSSLPDFAKLTATKTGVAPPKLLGGGIDVTAIAGGRRDRFALHLSGYVKIPRDHVYNFHIRGDDGARLVVDGERVVELDTHCVKDPWESEGDIGLRKGHHRVDVYYYQDNNRRKLLIKSRPGDEAVRKFPPADSWWTDAAAGGPRD
ncbi:MAG: PA14 domain-containing protein [Planctomycetota bacterium]